MDKSGASLEVLKDQKIEMQNNVGREIEAANNADNTGGKMKMTKKQDWDTRPST